jgi:hypothetical protein
VDQRAGRAREKRREFSVSWEWPVYQVVVLCVCVSVCLLCTSARILQDGSYSVIGNDSGQSLSQLALSAWNRYLAITMNYCVSPHRWCKLPMSQGIVVSFFIHLSQPTFLRVWDYHNLGCGQCNKLTVLVAVSLSFIHHYLRFHEGETLSYHWQSEFNKMTVPVKMWALRPDKEKQKNKTSD